jgi:hypothetical protein
MQSASRALRVVLAGAAVLLLYGIAALLYLHALWPRFGHLLAGRTADPVFNLYVLKWGVHQLRLGLPDLWNANCFYPVQGALALSDHLLGPALQLLLLLDLRLVPNAIAGYNLLLASSFVLSALTTCWVLRRSGRSWVAAALGGFMFAYAPVRWAHLEHIQLLLVQWLPLTLWTWDRLLAEPTCKRAALFLPCYLLNLTGGCYLAYMVHVPMLAIAAVRGAAGWRRLAAWRSLRVLLAAALPAAAAVYLLFAPYAAVANRYGLRRSPEEVALYAATLASYVAPAESNLYSGWWHALADRWQIDPSWDESRLFAGILASGLAAGGLLAFLRRHRTEPVRRPTAWQRAAIAAPLVLAAGCFLAGDLRTLQDSPAAGAWNLPALGFAAGLALWWAARRRWRGGALLRWAEIPPWDRGVALGGLLCWLLSFPIAFVPLMRVVPGLSSLRAPGRFGLITSFAVAYFAALGLDRLLPAAPRRRLAAAAVLALALGVDLAPAEVAARPLPDEAAFPPVYHYLRSLQPLESPGGDVRALLELPRLKFARESMYMYYSTLHWLPIANGYSGNAPASYYELRDAVGPLPDDAGFDELHRLGISHLVVHAAGPDGRVVRDALPDWEARYLGSRVARTFAAGGDSVYHLLELPEVAAPRLVQAPGMPDLPGSSPAAAAVAAPRQAAAGAAAAPRLVAAGGMAAPQLAAAGAAAAPRLAAARAADASAPAAAAARRGGRRGAWRPAGRVASSRRTGCCGSG